MEEMKEVAERLVGLRDAMEITQEQAAEVCGIPVEEYRKYESGELDVPLGVMFSLGKKYNIDLTTFITGDEPHKVSYFVTPKDKGMTVRRLADYHFESLAYGFANRKSDPFIVTINPGEIKDIHLTTHPGQEFNYVLEGKVRIKIGNNEVVLNEGDSLYFDSTKPHGMQNADDKRCRYITIILN